MEQLIKSMLDTNKWAVVGATQNTSKFGNIIYKRLVNAGYDVLPVNPVYSEIEGKPCYATLRALPYLPECLNIVVSPDKALTFIDEAAELGIGYIWFQPGSFTEQTLQYAREKGLNVVAHHCVLVELASIGK